MAISAKSERYISEVLNRLATGDTEDLDLEEGHGLETKMELQLLQGLKDVQTRINEQKLQDSTRLRQLETIARGDYSAEIAPRSDEDRPGVALFDMTKTLRDVAGVCQAIAVGDYSKKVEVKGDKDLLGLAVNEMVDNFAEIVGQADAIAKGDYSAEVAPRSDEDALGVSLFEMTKTLREADDHNRRENWLKDGQTALTDTVRGESDAGVVIDKSLATLATYLGAQVGVFYLADPGSGELRLAGTYAYDRRKSLNQTVVSGHGILGQAVKEKKSFIIEEVPEDHLSVDTGLGRSSPRNIVVVPILHEGSVKGVLELGSFSRFSDDHHELLRLVGETLAIAIGSAQDREQLAETLERSQTQAEELQSQQRELSETNQKLTSQQEELRIANSELSEQSEELRRSQEELETSNEELQEKGARLEEKRIEVESQNDNLVIAQRRVEEKARDLAQVSKYKSEFLANMSHELRTPLNSLLILSRSFTRNSTGNLTDEQVEEAEVIHSAGQALLTLINDILDLSKVEAGRLDVTFESVELRAFVDHLEQVFAPVTDDKGLELRIILDSGLPSSIVTDGHRAHQIVKNLVSNAAKFTESGSVTIEIAPADSATEFLNDDLVPSRTVAISVTDTGIGIPGDKQRLIFEAFQQADGSTSREFGGTGLGLTISRELTRLLGGELQLASEEGVGSRFTLYLPTRGAAVEKVAPTPESTSTDTTPITAPPFKDDREEIRDGDKWVLIIEDDVTFAGLLARVARKKGFKSMISIGGRGGLRLAGAHQPTGILLDLGLPDIGGVEVLDALKSNVDTRQIPVHIVSAQDVESSVLAMGALGMLTKPATGPEIEEVFASFERLSEQPVSNILLVEDNAGEVTAMRNLLRARGTEISIARTGAEGLSILSTGEFDCMILDLNLPDMTGFEVLATAQDTASITLPPVIVYTARELSQAEYEELEQHATSIVIKGAASPERLLSEVSLFLHSIDPETPLAAPVEEEALGQTVLVVDDDARNCFALSKVLREAGLKVKLASNGQDALDKLNVLEDVQLVVMDIMMPVMDGYEAIRKIRAQARFEQLPIVAVTAKVLPEERAKCLDVGANDYLPKPVDGDRLLSLIRVLLHESHRAVP